MIAICLRGFISDSSNHFDFEVEAGKPVHSQCGPVRIRRLGKYFILDLQDCGKLILWIGVKGGYVDDVVQRTATVFIQRLQ